MFGPGDDCDGGIINDKPKARARGKNTKRKDQDRVIDGGDFFSDKRSGARPNKYMNANHKSDVPFYFKRKRIKKKDNQTKLFDHGGDKSQKQTENQSLLDRKGKGGAFNWTEEQAKYIVNDIKTSRVYGYQKKRTREELEQADDQEELVITPIGAKKSRSVKKEKKKKKKRGRESGGQPHDDDQKQIGQHEDPDSDFETRRPMRQEAPDENYSQDVDSESESSTNNITFYNTANYGRNMGIHVDMEDPIVVKYSKGKGSVKGLHYMRYIALELLSEYTFTLSFHKFYSQEVKNLIKNIEKSRFDPELRKWTLSVQAYDLIMIELKKICSANQIHIEDIPQFTINLMKTKVPYSMTPHSYYGELQSRYDYCNDKSIHMELEEFCPPLIIKNLRLFQKENILKGLKFHGRILINDDPCGGKSLQALTLALAYRNEWPLLIICPVHLKYLWRQEILKWLPGLDIVRDIQIFKHSLDKIRPKTQILIISYEEVASNKNSKQFLPAGFKVVIIDEVQRFKEKAYYQRSDGEGKAILRLVCEMKRAILLTASKLLKRTKWLYYVMRMVRPDVMPSFFEFGYRYCDPRQAFEGIDFDNASNILELKKLLEKRIRVRHRREAFLTELPDVLRQKLEIAADLQYAVKIHQTLKTFILPWEDENRDQAFFKHMFTKQFVLGAEIQPQAALAQQLSSPSNPALPTFSKSLKSIFLDLYDLTALAKLKHLVNVIDHALQKDQRLVLFTLHLSLQTALEDHLIRHDTPVLNLGQHIQGNYSDSVLDQFVQRTSSILMIDLMHPEIESFGSKFGNMDDTICVFAEIVWISDIVWKAEKMVRDAGVKQVLYLFGRCTIDEYIYDHLIHGIGDDGQLFPEQPYHEELRLWQHQFAQDLELLLLEEDYRAADGGLRLTRKSPKQMIEIEGMKNDAMDEILGSNYDDLLKRSQKDKLKISWSKREEIYQICYREEEQKRQEAPTHNEGNPRPPRDSADEDDYGQENEEEMLNHRNAKQEAASPNKVQQLDQMANDDPDNFNTFQSNMQQSEISMSSHSVQSSSMLQQAHDMPSSMLSTCSSKMMSAQAFLQMQKSLKRYDPYLPTNQFAKFTLNSRLQAGTGVLAGQDIVPNQQQTTLEEVFGRQRKIGASMSKSSLTLKELKGKKGVGRVRIRKQIENGGEAGQLRLEDNEQPEDGENSSQNSANADHDESGSLSADEDSQECDDKDVIDDEQVKNMIGTAGMTQLGRMIFTQKVAHHNDEVADGKKDCQRISEQNDHDQQNYPEPPLEKQEDRIELGEQDELNAQALPAAAANQVFFDPNTFYRQKEVEKQQESQIQSDTVDENVPKEVLPVSLMASQKPQQFQLESKKQNFVQRENENAGHSLLKRFEGERNNDINDQEGPAGPFIKNSHDLKLQSWREKVRRQRLGLPSKEQQEQTNQDEMIDSNDDDSDNEKANKTAKSATESSFQQMKKANAANTEFEQIEKDSDDEAQIKEASVRPQGKGNVPARVLQHLAPSDSSDCSSDNY